MSNVGEYIKELRTKKGMTQEELGSLVGVKKAAVQKWESGLVQNLKRNTIKQLAEIFNVSPVSFVDDTSAEASNVAAVYTNNIYNIPVYESASAGFGAYACSDVIDYMPLYISNPAEAPDTIAINVKGDSMYPKIESGDTIVVHKQDSVDSGSLAVVLLDGEEALVKKVEYDKTWIDLVSINPEYQTRHFENEEVLRLKVVGLVKKIVKTV